MRNAPVGTDARRRLQEAQRAESVALSATTKAYAALARAQRRLDDARSDVECAIAALVDVSGVDRAAQLLDEPVAAVRRAHQRSARTITGPKGPPDEPPSP